MHTYSIQVYTLLHINQIKPQMNWVVFKYRVSYFFSSSIETEDALFVCIRYIPLLLSWASNSSRLIPGSLAAHAL